MRTGGVIGRGKGDVSAHQRFDREGSDDAGAAERVLRAQQRKDTNGSHLLSAVQECETFFCLQRQRNQAAPSKRLLAIDYLTVDFRAAATDQRQCQVRKRRQITRGANGPLLWNNGMDPGAQELEQTLDEDGSAAAVALG